MYIDHIQLNNFRTFRKTRIDFCHPDQNYRVNGGLKTELNSASIQADGLDFTKPTLSNINLLLGNNGLGKTTLLKAIALVALGPAVKSSGIYANRLVRREPASTKIKSKIDKSSAKLVAQMKQCWRLNSLRMSRIVLKIMKKSNR